MVKKSVKEVMEDIRDINRHFGDIMKNFDKMSKSERMNAVFKVIWTPLFPILLTKEEQTSE